MRWRWMYSLASVAAISLLGCATAPETKSVEAGAPNSDKVFITKRDGACFYYKKQCVACGAVSEQRLGAKYSKGVETLTDEFICPKCGKKQEVQIDMKPCRSMGRGK